MKAKGKVLETHKGYNVRQMTKSKVDEKTKIASDVHTGKFGIYAGKKLIKEISKQVEAKPIIDALVEESIKKNNK
jgi:nitrite reductase/ring-hydroxylating ferredoxin subunit